MRIYQMYFYLSQQSSQGNKKEVRSWGGHDRLHKWMQNSWQNDYSLKCKVWFFPSQIEIQEGTYLLNVANFTSKITMNNAYICMHRRVSLLDFEIEIFHFSAIYVRGA